MAKIFQVLDFEEDFRGKDVALMPNERLVEKLRAIVDELGVKEVNGVLQDGMRLYFGEWLSNNANLSAELIKSLEDRVPELKFGAESDIKHGSIKDSLKWIPEDPKEPFWLELTQRKLRQIFDQFSGIQNPGRLLSYISEVFQFLAQRPRKELFNTLFENEAFVASLKEVASVPGMLNPFYYCNVDKSRDCLLLHAYLNDVWIEGVEELYLTKTGEQCFLRMKFLTEAMKDEDFVKKTLENPKIFGFKDVVSTITHEIRRGSGLASRVLPQTASAMKLFLENAEDLPIDSAFCEAIGELSFDVANEALKDPRVCEAMKTCQEDFVYGVMEQFNKTECLDQDFWNKLSLAAPFDFEAVNFHKVVGLYKYGTLGEDVIFKRARLAQDFLKKYDSSLGENERFIRSITQSFWREGAIRILEKFEGEGIIQIDDAVLSKVLSENDASTEEYYFAIKRNPDILNQVVNGVPVWWNLGLKIRKGSFWGGQVKDFNVHAEDGQSFPFYVLGKRFGTSRIDRPEAYRMIKDFVERVDPKTYDFNLNYKDSKDRNILHHFFREANVHSQDAEKFVGVLKKMGLKKSLFKKMLGEKDERGFTPFDYFMDLPEGQVHKDSFSFKILEEILKNIEFAEDYRNDHNFNLVSRFLDTVSEETSLQEKQKIETQLIFKVTHSDKPEPRTARSPFKI